MTAPGRQGSSADELVSTIARATNAGVRVVSAEEEGRLAFLGAVNAVRLTPLGVTRFGQSGDLDDVYRHHEIDAGRPHQPRE